MSFEFGLFGLGVMGQNVALNIAEHGFKIAVHNRSESKVDTTVARAKEELGDQAGNLVGFKDAKEFVAALAKPRKLMFLVTAGPVVDKVIDMFAALLEPGDILIDGGNEWYENSERRAAHIKDSGVHYVAMGVSGGEAGARKGPSMMPGGPAEAYEALKPILEKIAASTDSGPCVTHIGTGAGCGNYVKMVHNGIEYGDEQLIAEAYTVLKYVGGLNNDELSKVFADWNGDILDSFLIELTSKIFAKKDGGEHMLDANGKVVEGLDESKYVIDMILDRTGNKGTGKMTIKEGADRGVAVSTMTAALDTRFISFDKDARTAMEKLLPGPEVTTVENKELLIEDVKHALYCSKIMSYAQGMNLIRQASRDFDWGIDLGECARIWKAGCIIRARFLDRIKTAYDKNPELESLLIDPEFTKEILEGQAAWRRIVALCAQEGLPCPAFGASLSYFDAYRRSTLYGASLVQAQRDFFGSHTFERKDKPQGEMFHCLWTDDHSATTGH